MEEGCNEGYISPLLPRLDRLDMLMKYIERKHNLSRWKSDVISPFERRCMPMDLALRDAHTKGSVLDRLALLEHRLIQLTLEMEASSVSSSSTVYTCEIPSTRQGFSNRQQLDDDFHSFDGRSLDHPQTDNQYEVYNTHNHNLQVNGELNRPPDARESSITECKSKAKGRSRKSCRCNRLLGC